MILERHTPSSKERGEQGDPLMPLLFSLGQHSALEAVNSRLQEDDKLMAFLDDVYVVYPRPDSVLHSYTALEEELWTHAGIRINGGKTRVWNRSGSQPRGCDILQRIAIQSDPDAVVWRGSDVPTVQQGIKILGTPLGHNDYAQNHLDRVADEHQRFIDMLLPVPNLQSSWLLLVHCASARANYLLRTVCPDSVRRFAEAHDRGLWECVCTLLNIPNEQDQSTRDTATLPLSLGGLVFGVPSEQALQPSGPVGQIACR